MSKIRALLYCTKAKPYLVKRNIFAGLEPSYFTLEENVEDNLNGTIVAECEIEVEELLANNYIYNVYWEYETFNVKQKELLVKSCLDYEQLLNYLRGYNGYALHISNLKVFDKAKELGDYYCGIPKKMNNLNGECYVNVNIDKAPQNMMYAIDDEDNEYILISIQPQWLCKIINGEKTIEVRKKVLNCMKESE